jgi:hypothetical protein
MAAGLSPLKRPLCTILDLILPQSEGLSTLSEIPALHWAGAIKRRETDVQAVWMKSGKPASQTPHGPSTMPKLSEPTRTRLTCLLGCNIADLRAGPLRRGEVGHGDHHAFVHSLPAEEP